MWTMGDGFESGCVPRLSPAPGFTHLKGCYVPVGVLGRSSPRDEMQCPWMNLFC